MTQRLKEGVGSIARMILLGISMDVIYQIKVFDQFYPVEAVMMAILLAVIPYFVFRWIVEHIARWWFARQGNGMLVMEATMDTSPPSPTPTRSPSSCRRAAPACRSSARA